MNTLIIYMSNYGTTSKVAEKISDLLGYNRSKTINLSTDDAPDLSSYDTIIIGGSVRLGKIQKEMTRFCIDNLDELMNKKVGLFMCCMDEEHQQEEFEASYPAELIQHAQATSIFGGELHFDKMNFVEKLMVKAVRKEKKNISRLNYQAINHFAIQMGA